MGLRLRISCTNVMRLCGEVMFESPLAELNELLLYCPDSCSWHRSMVEMVDASLYLYMETWSKEK